MATTSSGRFKLELSQVRLQTDQQEDQRVNHKSQKLPEILKRESGCRGGVLGAEVTDEKTGGDNRQDAAHVELFGDDKRSKGEGDAGRGLNQMIVHVLENDG